MKTQNVLGLFALFSIIILAANVSAIADLTLTAVDVPTSVDNDDGSFDIIFNLINDGDTAESIDWTDSFASQGSISLPSTVIGIGETKLIQATVTFPVGSSGTISGTIEADPALGDSESLSFSVAITDEPGLVLRQITPVTSTEEGVIELENTGNILLTGITLSETGPLDATFSKNNFNLAVGEIERVGVLSSGLTTSEFGEDFLQIRATGSNGVQEILSLSFRNSFCKAGHAGNDLELNIEIDNQGEGDDNEWTIKDRIEIEVEAQNDNDDDEIEDVVVEIGLFDENGKNLADDLDFESDDEEEVEVGDIDDGDEETTTFIFTVPADFDEGDYKLAVKAYSDDLGEDVECVDESNDLSDNIFESIRIERETEEERFVIVDDIVLDDQVSCGETSVGSFTVFNIGDEEQERVRVEMRSSDLGLDRDFEITKDLDEGDDEKIRFDFPVPFVADGFYTIEFKTFYDYSRGEFREESEDTFVSTLNVVGCTGGPGPVQGGTGGVVPIGQPTNLIITADLDSDARSGSELVVVSDITNTGNSVVSFTVDGQGFETWATLQSVSPGVLTLNPGQTGTATFTFDVNDDSSGAQSFVVETKDITDNRLLEIREVEVNIGGTGSGSGGFSLGTDNSLIWAIGLVNVILIILIIIVAVRLSRR